MAEFTVTIYDATVDLGADEIVGRMDYDDDLLLDMFEELTASLTSDSKRENFSTTLIGEWNVEALSNLRLGLLQLATDLDNYIKEEIL